MQNLSLKHVVLFAKYSLSHTYHSIKKNFQQVKLKNQKTNKAVNKVEQWYIRHNYFIVLYHRLHVLTYIQVVFRPSFTGKSIKCYTCWDPVMLTEVKYIKI